MARKPWKKVLLTENQKKFIQDNYLSMPVKTMEKALNVPEGVITRRMKKWGLVVPREIIEQRKRDSQFSKGQVPFNKGKKITDFMSPKQIEKSKKNRFKKGNKPINTKSGRLHISVRKDKRGVPYQYIKVDDSFWEMLHIFNWHKAYGEIPEGKIVVFKNGNTLNCHPSNLQAITKAENLKRNRKKHFELPRELQKTVRLVNKIKKSLTT